MVVEGKIFKLYLIFLGIFYFDIDCIIGLGIVIDFKVIIEELD